MNSVPAQALISPAAAEFSQQLVSSDGVMNIYLHAPGGAIGVSGGGLGAQTIQSVPISLQDQDYIRSIVNRLDSIIDLDFAFVGEAAQADTSFYYDQEIALGESISGETLGLSASGSVGWELFVNYPVVASNLDYRQYVNIHECGHSLGLEHPFEASDGDIYNENTDPWTSAFPEQTVMAYRSPESGDWPDFFTTSDLIALIEIWGAENKQLSSGNDVFTGNLYRDVISGLGGNDQVIGGNGDDRISGNAGSDWLQGSVGNDEILGGSGNDLLRGGMGNDWLTGDFGDDQIWGDLGADRIRLSSGNDQIWGFSALEGDRLELDQGISFSLELMNEGIQIRTMLGVTTLVGVFDQATVNSVIDRV